MGYGTDLTLEELALRDGTVRRLVSQGGPQSAPGARHPDDDPRDLPDLDLHFTLSSAYPADHPLLIVADRLITIDAPSPFTRFEVLILNNVTAFIGLDRDAHFNPGQYDRRHPGSALDDARTRPCRRFTIMFRAVPADPVEIHLQAGYPALSK